MQRLAEPYGVFLGGLKTNRARDLAQARGGSVRDSVASGVSLRGFSFKMTDMDEVTAYLTSGGPGGRLLPKSVVTAIVARLTDLAIDEVDFVKEMSGEDLLGIYNEQTGQTVETCSIIISHAILAFASPRAKSPGRNSAANVSIAGDKDDEFAQILGAAAFADSKSQLKRDERAMGLKEGEIIALNASFFCGAPVDELEVEGEKYASDPSSYEVVMRKRKSKSGEMIMELLASKDGHGVMELFSTLIRAYNERGQTAQVAVLTGVKTELDGIYVSDLKGLLEYIRAYLRKYRGRGFPVAIDYALVIKNLKSQDTTALRESNEKLSKAVVALQSKMESLSSKVDAYKRIVDKIPLNKFQEGGGKKDTGKGKDRAVEPDFECKICGAVGEHWTSNCPLKKDRKLDFADKTGDD